jgi:hypothetical protein
MLSSLWRLLKALPVLLGVCMAYVFICFVCAGFVELQLMMMGANKNLALGAALLTAVGVYTFIAYNHRIRAFIDGWRS